MFFFYPRLKVVFFSVSEFLRLLKCNNVMGLGNKDSSHKLLRFSIKFVIKEAFSLRLRLICMRIQMKKWLDEFVQKTNACCPMRVVTVAVTNMSELF